jgi:hypothetical protein
MNMTQITASPWCELCTERIQEGCFGCDVVTGDYATSACDTVAKSAHPIYPPPPFDEPVQPSYFVLGWMTATVAAIKDETPERQRRLLGMFLTLLERAGVEVPEVWRCSLEEMD